MPFVAPSPRAPRDRIAEDRHEELLTVPHAVAVSFHLEQHVLERADGFRLRITLFAQTGAQQAHGRAALRVVQHLERDPLPRDGDVIPGRAVVAVERQLRLYLELRWQRLEELPGGGHHGVGRSGGLADEREGDDHQGKREVSAHGADHTLTKASPWCNPVIRRRRHGGTAATKCAGTGGKFLSGADSGAERIVPAVIASTCPSCHPSQPTSPSISGPPTRASSRAAAASSSTNPRSSRSIPPG